MYSSLPETPSPKAEKTGRFRLEWLDGEHNHQHSWMPREDNQCIVRQVDDPKGFFFEIKAQGLVTERLPSDREKLELDN